MTTWQEEGYQLAPQQLARLEQVGSAAVRIVRTPTRVTSAELESRLAKAVATYEILRTRYTTLAGLDTPVQIMEPVGPVAAGAAAAGRTVLSSGALTVEHELGPEGTRLMLTLPRLSLDDASWSRLVSLLLEDSAADEAELQYADAAAWLGEVLEQSAQSVAGEPARAASVPPFVLTEEVVGEAGGEPVHASILVDGPALVRLDELAERCGVSEAAALLALWRALYGRFCGDAEDRVVVLADGRSTEGLEDVLGLLERPVPVRLELAPGASSADAMRAAHDALGSVAKTENHIDPAAALACGIPLSFRHREDRWAAEIEAAESELISPALLHLDGVRGPGGLRLDFFGGAGRVAQADLDVVAQAYRCQLDELLAKGAEHAIGGLRLTVPNEPSSANEPRERHASVLELFLGQAEATPERPALRCGEIVLSYRDAAQRAVAVAELLRERGVQAGQRVALFAPAAAETVVAMLGIWLAGSAFVPVDPTWPQQRIDTILREAAAALTHTPAHAEFVDAGLRLPERAEAAGAAYVIFTSGTSGVPKGVVIGHEQVAHYTAAVGTKLGLSEGAEFAAVSTLAADLAYTAIFPTLASGGCVQIVPPETATSPAALAAWFRENPAAAMKSVPSHLAVLLAEAADPLALLPTEALVLGGERLPRQLYRRLREIAPHLRVYNHYGPTETTVGASCLALDDTVDERCSSIPVGQGLGANTLAVVDEAGAPLPPWCPGEVVVRGPGIGLGYLARLREGLAGFADAEAGSAALYRTGDLGRLVPGAGVEILGRIDDQVKLRGHRVQIGEIETLLAARPGVGAAAVVPRADEGGLVTHLDAYLVAAADAPAPSIEELRTDLGDRLPAALVPTGWQLLDRLPLTGNGKLDRRALAPIAPRRARAGRPRDSVEQRLVALWSAVLDLDVTSPDDDFFELGGQSLRAIKLMAQVNKAFGCQLPMSAVFSAPTVAAMAALVRESGVRDTNLVPLRAGREPAGDPVFCFHPGVGDTLSYWELARALPADRPVIGVESWGLHGRDPQRDITAMAEEYAAAIAAAGDAAPTLIGWCFGGAMAYHTAHALRRAGRAVARLIIVNSGVPDPADGGLAQRPADHLIRRFADRYELEPPTDQSGPRDLLKALQGIGRLPQDAGEAELRHLLEVHAANMTALDRFHVVEHGELGRPDFPILLVRAESAEEPPAPDRTCGWAAAVGPELAFAAIETTHHGILRRPALAQLAGLIERELNA